MRSKKIVITAGGTGGHLYPAQALAQQIMNQDKKADVLFLAGGLGKNRCFDPHRFPFREVVSSPLLSRNPLKCLRGMRDLLKGVQQGITILKEYSPDVVVGFGSFYTVPTLLAARWLKIPIILHEANSIPGKANRWLAPLADYVGVHFPFTTSFFKGKSIEVGLPLREGYSLEAISKEEAVAYYGLSSNHKILLVCGGSQGAKAINLIMEKCFSLLKQLDIQLIHLTGDPVKAAELSDLYRQNGLSACVKGFEQQMHMAWRAADAFVGRSGASTIAESMEFEVPGILIPYPYATDNHQEKNADFLVKTVQSGWKLIESSLTPDLLASTIEELFDPDNYRMFKQSLKGYKEDSHRLTLCDLVLERKIL